MRLKVSTHNEVAHVGLLDQRRGFARAKKRGQNGDALLTCLPYATLRVDQRRHDRRRDVLQVELVTREREQGEHDDVQDVLADSGPLVA